MSSHRCPHCRERVLQKSADGVKLRTTMVIFQEDGHALIKCRKCKADFLIEATLGDDLRKSLDQTPRRLVVSRGLRSKLLDPPDSAQ